MASIHKRNGKYAVMYNYVDENGKRRQKWESFKTQAEAMKRKKEVEYKKVAGTLTVPKCTTMSELLNEYVAMYGNHPMGRMGVLYRTVLSEWKAWSPSEGNRKDAADVSASMLVQPVR